MENISNESNETVSAPIVPVIPISPEIEELRFFYDLMLQSSLLELETQTSLGKVILKRTHLEKPTIATVSTAVSTASHRRKMDPSEEKKEVAASHLKTVDSPITGVFYRSSSPQAAPFCKEGQSVKSGHTLCIIEAMKVMNEVKSEINGKIVKILVENAKPVTQGQPLYSIDPS